MLLAVLLLLMPAHAASPTPALSGDACEAPYNLVVPADLVNERAGLTILASRLDESNSLGFELKPTSCTVTIRRDGADAVVARGKSRKPVASGDIVLKVRDGRVSVAYGATTIARGKCDVPVGGTWGVVDGQPEDLEAIWCQPVGEAVFADDFMRGDDEENPWAAEAGEWALSATGVAAFSANAFQFAGSGAEKTDAVASAGDWFWEDHTVEASVRPDAEATAFGVGLGLHDNANYHALRFTYAERPNGRVEIVARTGGKDKALAKSEWRMDADEWHRMSISAVEGRVTGTIDGVEVIAADAPGLAHGKALLTVTGATPVAFDDVAIYPGAKQTPRTVLARADDAATSSFLNDHYMQEWSDENSQWKRAGDSAWHAGYFWGDVELIWDADEKALAQPSTLHICVPSDGQTSQPPPDAQAGYRLAMSPGEGDALALELSRGAEVKATGSVARTSDLRLRRRGATVEAVADGATVLGFEDDAPLGGGKVGFSGPASQTRALSIASANVIDSAFRSAPTEWSIGQGDWRVRSRWACTPRWAWFNGRDPEMAAIWTRDEFEGDVVVEFFAGIPMDQPWAPFYQGPSNIFVTLCAQNETPGTGYSFVLGGWKNRASGIFRQGEVVTQTPDLTLPDILDGLGSQVISGPEASQLHKEWWHVRAERAGNAARLFVDGKLVAEYEDAAPLPGGAVGIWTVENGLTIARARVYYERPKAPEHGRGAEVGSASEAGWRSISSGSRVASGGQGVTITNVAAGGTFAVEAPTGDIDLATTPILEFEYAIPEGVKIDAFPIVDGRTFRARMTGPVEMIRGIETVGDIEAKPDGKWHRATVDLGGMLLPYSDAPVLEALRFGSRSREGYLHAGIGGNWAGATYQLRNLAFRTGPTAPPPDNAPQDMALKPWGVDSGAEIRIAREARDGDWCEEVQNAKIGGPFGAELTGVPFEATRYPTLRFDYRIDDEARVDIVVEVDGSKRQIRFTDSDTTWPVIGDIEATADDAWHSATVDLLGLLKKAFPGQASLPVTRIAFASTGWPGNRRGTCYWLDNVDLVPATEVPTDEAPPTAQNVSPAPSEAACTRVISATLTDEGSGISPADIRLTVGEAVYSIVDRELTHDAASGQVSFTSPGPIASDGATVACTLAAGDLAGNEMAPLEWSWTVDHAADTEPPPAPVVSYVPVEVMAANGFEDNVGEWGNFLSCQVRRLDSGGATGPGCIELTDLRDRSGSVYGMLEDFGEEWRRFPMLRFRYRGENARGGSMALMATAFNGSSEAWAQLGSLSVSDEWQTATVDLAKAVGANQDPHRLFLNLRVPNADGAVIIDDYAMYSRTAESAGLRWSAPSDASGVSGYSWALDSDNATVPPETITGTDTSTEFTGLEPGHYCFHIRARDNAGNWSATTHVPFEIE